MNLVATVMHIVMTAGQGGRHCQPALTLGKSGSYISVFKAVNKMILIKVTAALLSPFAEW